MPIGLQINPYESTDNPASVRVKNLAPFPIRVGTQDLILHSRCVGTATRGITVTPAGFVLQPGQVRTVIVRVPAGRNADYGVVFAGTPVHPQPGVDLIAGGVGFQVRTGGASSCIPKAAPHPTSAGFPVAASVGIALAGMFALLLILGFSLRRRHHNRRATTE